MTSVLDLWQQRVDSGQLKPDPHQKQAAEKLDQLARAMEGYTLLKPASWLSRLCLWTKKQPVPRGLYIHGEPGRGKSMLMDLFFGAAAVRKKRRVHFHAFMLEVHRRLHEKRIAMRGDALPLLAREIADEAWLLCFDEFHVVDIADAMILGRLFTALLDLGVVVVATSNWPPDDLYKDGLQRALFLPFIALVKARMDVLALDGPVDWRLDRLRGHPVYFSPLGEASHQALARVFSGLTDNATSAPETLNVHGRTLEVPRAAAHIAWFTFAQLCQQPLGAADYLALAGHYSAILIEGVPRLNDDLRNEAKRFMTLIDALYEHRTRVIISAEAPPGELYPQGRHAFEFQRTTSRLTEMQAADYLASRHMG
ncbi:MAG: cell division protein ZapE [Pseudomonadota bacterium]|nr:cell division protein ZapE [Pseudomonadota bacterium]